MTGPELLVVAVALYTTTAGLFAWGSWRLAHRPEPQGRVTSDGRGPR